MIVIGGAKHEHGRVIGSVNGVQMAVAVLRVVMSVIFYEPHLMSGRELFSDEVPDCGDELVRELTSGIRVH